MNIDWSKAPEWAIAHALHAFGGEISEVWVGEFKYQRLDSTTDYPYGGGNGDARHNSRRSEFRFETPRVVDWNGEGLPPVGTVCEYRDSLGAWEKVEITAIARKGICFVQNSHGGENYAPKDSEAFRPIRTAEQIEAEEIQAIEQWLDANIEELGALAKTLHKAGYRKDIES